MEKFTLETLATFKGSFIIEAESEAKAREIFDKHCAMGMLKEPRGYHDAVIDFSIDMHPDTEVVVSVSKEPKR